MPESNKTEKATPQRRKKAREEGQVVRSREFGSLLAVIGAMATLRFVVPDMAVHWRGFYNSLLTSATEGEIDSNGVVLYWTAVEVLRWIGPVLLVAMMVSVGVTIAQGGISFAPSALAFKFSRMNPSARLGQVFSLTSMSAMAKSLLPFGLIALFGVTALSGSWGALARASTGGMAALLAVTGQALVSVAWKSALVLLAWGGIDYFLTWRQNESKLKMSKEEVKRDHKESDGNPFIKGQVRKRQRAMRDRRKPLAAAATATMVVTNPTHFAVALRYDQGMSAPEVVAKGLDLLAQKIKAIAAENDVPVVENKVLARSLYKNVEVGQKIPSDLYQAVAEILVVVFRAQAEVREREAMRSRLNAFGRETGSR